MSWATHGRTSTNSNDRGSSEDRRRRKLWLLETFGDGTTVACAFDDCDVVLTFETITVDRFPTPKIDGGTYARGNIRPACADCNTRHGLELAARRRAEKRAREKEAAA